jgi:hypothetical protein
VIFQFFISKKKQFLLCQLWGVVCRLMRDKTIQSILEWGCNLITKCVKSEGVWIFCEVTVSLSNHSISSVYYVWLLYFRVQKPSSKYVTRYAIQ